MGKSVSAPPPPQEKEKCVTSLYKYLYLATDADMLTRTHVGLHAEVSVAVV
jgi:hypothetical protein